MGLKIFGFDPLRLGLMVAALGIWSGCGDPTYPNRQALTVDSVNVQSLSFYPLNPKFILADSQSQVRLGGYHIGYRCAEYLDIGLDSLPENPTLFRPVLRLRLPGAPTCAMDSIPHDSILNHIFRTDSNTQVYLANSSRLITDSAFLVHGKALRDSFQQTLDSLTMTAASGRWLFRDSTGLFQRGLFVDSLSPCEILDHAEYARRNDTILVRISGVTLDSDFVHGVCSGKPRTDSMGLSPGTF